MKNIAVVFGGTSVESEVSVITGVLTVNSLDRTKYNAVPVYIDKSGSWYTGELFDLDGFKNLDGKKLKRAGFFAGDNRLHIIKGKKSKKQIPIAAIINCLHGECGEDGSLSGLANLCGIPLVGSAVAPASVSMNKKISKLALRGLKVPVLPFVVINDAKQIEETDLSFGFPVIVKPESGGSSIGIKKANDKNQLRTAVNYALRYGKNVIVEPLLSHFVEINCAARKNAEGEVIVSECERPIGAEEVLTFADKYEEGKREFPAKIGDKLTQKIKTITQTVYKELDFSGVIRIDYFLTNGKVYLNEINSVPGSMAYYLFCDTLKEYTSMLTELITVAEREFATSCTYVRVFRSGILSAGGSKGAKKVEKNKRLC